MFSSNLMRAFKERVEKCPKVADVRSMIFYRRPHKVNSAHSLKLITMTLLKYSFSVPRRSKNN